MRTYSILITGRTPFIMHHDNIEWADQMAAWGLDPKNASASKAGDDRTPPYRWLGSLYDDGAHAVVPSDNVMRAIMTGGAMLRTGKGPKTFKAQTQSGMLAPDVFWAFKVGKTVETTPGDYRGIPIGPYRENMETRTFDEFQQMAAADGFMLFVKRAKIGQSKHIRVRPRFDNWSLTGDLVVTDEAITLAVLNQIGDLAGRYAGLGDWRPSSKTPGPYGMFGFTAKEK